jgi:four helix bundle protein
MIGASPAIAQLHDGGCPPRQDKEVRGEWDSFREDIDKDRSNAEIAAQLTDAASSVASNYRAVCRARSRADFIDKLGVAIEEADESALWLEILAEAGIVDGVAIGPLWQEADELTRILVRSRETARNNRESRNRQ